MANGFFQRLIQRRPRDSADREREAAAERSAQELQAQRQRRYSGYVYSPVGLVRVQVVGPPRPSGAASKQKLKTDPELKFLVDQLPSAVLPEPDPYQEPEECPICQDELEHPAAVNLCCGHTFHRACIRTWLARKPTCPTCRLVLTEESMRRQIAAGPQPAPWYPRSAASSGSSDASTSSRSSSPTSQSHPLACDSASSASSSAPQTPTTASEPSTPLGGTVLDPAPSTSGGGGGGVAGPAPARAVTREALSLAAARAREVAAADGQVRDGEIRPPQPTRAVFGPYLGLPHSITLPVFIEH